MDLYGIPVEIIDGVPCTNRAGLCQLTGWTPGNLKGRANTDPDFPHPKKITKKVHWYPIEGDNGVDAYLDILATRAAAKKPPPVKPGNPHELLDPDGVAAELGIEKATVRSYVRLSKPYWERQKQGRPILPKPDRVTQVARDDGGTYTRREWYRSTLAVHQANRPGPGGGQPPKRPDSHSAPIPRLTANARRETEE